MENKIELNKNLEFVAPVNDINVLLIAPHGVQGDDDNTGELTRLMAKKLGCAAIINEHYKKPRKIKGSNKEEAVSEKDAIVNLNSVKEIEAAGLEGSYLNFIKQTKDSIRKNNKGNPCYVFLIHGIDDDKLADASKGNSQVLIGIGSHVLPESSCWSANLGQAKEFIKILKKLDTPVSSEITTHKNYAGLNYDNLTQALCEQQEVWGSRHAQCIQLEIKKDGFRDNGNLNKTSDLLTQAIKQLTSKFNIPALALEAVGKEEDVKQKNAPALLREKYINILLIAPHAHYSDDDIQIAALTREMGHLLGCPTIINEEFRIPKLCGRKKNGARIYEKPAPRKKIADWFKIEDAEQVLQKELISPLKKVIEAPGKTLIVWLHNEFDKKLGSRSKREDGVSLSNECMFQESTQNWECRAGIFADSFIQARGASVSLGEKDVKLCVVSGLDEKGVPNTIITHTLSSLSESLNKSHFGTVLGWEQSDTSMLSWFVKNDVSLQKVESISLEIKGSECLNSVENIKGTAQALSLALMDLTDNVPEQVEDKQLIARAYNAIIKSFNLYVEQAVTSVGEYIVEEFYRGDYELARKGQQGVHKKKSLNTLIEQLNETPGAPSKSWIYNAVKLVVEVHDIEQNDPELFQTYGKLLLSHKVLLLSVKSLKKKKELIDEIIKENYTIRQLKERLGANSANKVIPFLHALNSPDKFVIDYDDLIETEAISQLSLPVIQKAHDKAAGKVKEFEDKIASLNQKIEEQRQFIARYNHVVSSLEAAAKVKEQGDVQQVPADV